ncbi:Ig-like domain-containing protein, partial [Algoriphagus sp.]|uniref:Ig-like domain-containing protein n=1 Tax=Algoriphagus sp. TaxID=1872435 RepID=UPI0025D83E05
MSFATDYYFSTNNGDDSRTILEAQNPNTPWKTIDKLNAISSGLKAGDRVLFEAGNTFYGTINVVKGGSSGNPIIYTSYGLGAQPVITSLETIESESWRSLGGGIYEASIPNLESSIVQIFEIDNSPVEIGRFPNSFSEEPYLEIKNVLNQNSLSGEFSFPNLEGAELVIRKNNWIIDRHPISSSSGTTINFQSIVTAYETRAGSGYFVQNHVSTLDSFGEWAYNSRLKTVSAYIGPKKASTFKFKIANKDHLVVNQPYIQNITFRNLHFKGSNKSIFSIKKSGNFIIDKCILESAGENGIYAEEVPDLTISNNTIKNSLNDGIFVYYGAPRIKIQNNIVENTLPFAGMGKSSDLTGVGIYVPSDTDYGLIERNQVLNTAYNGIHFGGDYTIVKNNLVDRFCVFKQDGGGIYTNADNQFTRNNKGREIVGNIVLNGIGNIDGTEEEFLLAHGIYNDDNSAGIKVYKNTIANINGNGYFVHNNNNIEISDNLIFKAQNQLNITHDVLGGPVRDMIIKNNTFSSIFENEVLMNFSSIDYDLNQAGIIDENYFLDPYNRDFVFQSREPNNGPTAVVRDFESWKNEFGFDENSEKSRFNLVRYDILTRDEIKSSSFDSNIDFVAATYGGVGQFIPDGINGGSLSLKPNPGGNLATYIQIGAVTAGEQILLEFDSKSSLENKEVILFLEKTFEQNQKGSLRYFSTTSESKRIQIGFTAEVSAPGESIVLKIEDPADAVIFDNMVVSKVTTSEIDIREYIRFEYNYSDEEVTLPLPGIYRDAENNIFENKVTIPPYGSALLVKFDSDQLELPETQLEISIIDPVQNQEFLSGEDVNIKTDIIDPEGLLAGVIFFHGDSLLSRQYEAPFEFTWSSPSPGDYSLLAAAVDFAGGIAVSEFVQIKVLDEVVDLSQAPTVEIQSPSQNQSFDLGTDVLISTLPIAGNGTIDRVEIFAGNSLIGTVSQAPYEITWSPTSINSYTIYAKVYNTEGGEGTSNNILVNITEPPLENLPPSIEIINPTDEQFFILGQDVLIQTNPIDPENKISRVEFYSGEFGFATVYEAPFEFTYPNPPAGSYTVKTKVFDDQGLSAESNVVNINVLDPSVVNLPPIISIKQPINEVVFETGKLINIVTEITDPENDIDRVEIFSNGNLISTITANPFNFEWTANVTPGTYLVNAVAYDNSGNSAQTKNVIVHIVPPVEENFPPTVSISQPYSGEEYSYESKILIKTNPYDIEDDIKKVEIFADGSLLAILSKAPYDYAWTKIPIGPHSLYAVVTDNDGQTGISEIIDFTVKNFAPTIDIVDPIDGQTFNSGDDVLIKTEPLRFDETNKSGFPLVVENDIERVEFFYNEQIFAIVTEAPFEYNWESPPAGTYTLKAKVFDAFGLSSESKRPTIQVL